MRIEVYQYSPGKRDYSTPIEIEANYHNFVRFEKMKALYEVENGEYMIVLYDDDDMAVDQFTSNDYDFI